MRRIAWLQDCVVALYEHGQEPDPALVELRRRLELFLRAPGDARGVTLEQACGLQDGWRLHYRFDQRDKALAAMLARPDPMRRGKHPHGGCT